MGRISTDLLLRLPGHPPYRPKSSRKLSFCPQSPSRILRLTAEVCAIELLEFPNEIPMAVLSETAAVESPSPGSDIFLSQLCPHKAHVKVENKVMESE